MIQRLPTVQMSVYQQKDTTPSDLTAVCISAKRYSACRLYSCLYISKKIHLPNLQLSVYRQNDTVPADCTAVCLSAAAKASHKNVEA
jgi:hypothetical protein